MKILNVDAFASIERQLSIGGNLYPIVEPSVQEFIDNLKAAEQLEKEGTEGTASASESFERALKNIKESVPDIPDEVLKKLKLPAVMAILQFIRGELDPDVADAVGKEAAEGEKKQG